MKIFSADQIRLWDRFTIAHEPVSSLDLMERAAAACAEWIDRNIAVHNELVIFCGPGNNGGDGLAIARLMATRHRKVHLYMLESSQYSPGFMTNLQRLDHLQVQKHYLRTREDFPDKQALRKAGVVIDALYGSGLNRPLEGIAAALVAYLNESQTPILSIDIASGLFADKCSAGNAIIRPTHTLSFQTWKLAFLLPENEPYTGAVNILDIGLHTAYYQATDTPYELVTETSIRCLYRPRKSFAHKGNYGNLLLMAGSYGMMGAAVLAAKACLRSGAGKLTCYVPRSGYAILQTAVPEAMCLTDQDPAHITSYDVPGHFDAVAAGPGIGQHQHTSAMLKNLLKRQGAMVLDADALNLLATQQHLYRKLPPHTILTPHPKEFERLFGKTSDHFERLQLAVEKAQELGIYIVLKGKYTVITTPSGKAYFNTTGNPGMATGGSGDVLTGILLGLLGQYSVEDAVLLGVFLHGLAGDIAANRLTQEAMTAGDIIHYLPAAFQTIHSGYPLNAVSGE